MVMPALAGVDTVLRNHGARMIGDPNATWGVTEGNPIWEEIREAASGTLREVAPGPCVG